MPVSKDGGYAQCDEEGCEAAIPNHVWGRVKAAKWFFTKDGGAWCPKHQPTWYEAWAKKVGHVRK